MLPLAATVYEKILNKFLFTLRNSENKCFANSTIVATKTVKLRSWVV